MIQTLGLTFDVSQINRAVSVDLPTVISRNQFDNHGALVSLSRLTGEKNAEYKRRIQDVWVNIANSSYRGLVNGITRELGLSINPAININPISNSDGSFVAPDPYIRFDGIWLYLYSDYANDILDWKIDRYQSGGNFEHLHRLVDQVNETSFFEASMIHGVNSRVRSMTIINQSNRESVKIERLQNSNKFKLGKTRLVEGSVIFANRDVFLTEVDSENDVISTGKYFINYTTGVVTSYNVPTIADTVRYDYIVYPFQPVYSPIILHDINDDNFKVKMFQQILNDDQDAFDHGLPTELGVDIINELLSVHPLYWGI